VSPSRNDDETTPACPVCGNPFTPVRRQRYCGPACRQAAWRARHNQPAAATITVPHTRRRRDGTVYGCPDCEQRYLGEQWCPDCQRPCRRIDIGGLCPHCEEPVAISDLIDQHVPSSTPGPTNPAEPSPHETRGGGVQGVLTDHRHATGEPAV
jgi:hypothetical protein